MFLISRNDVMVCVREQKESQNMYLSLPSKMKTIKSIKSLCYHFKQGLTVSS